MSRPETPAEFEGRRAMAWSIAEVARMSGVTSRTLRHYDEVGLLPPARTGANGIRIYTEPELLRLQQILVLRELDLGLAEIRRILDEQSDPVEALQVHHKRLLAEQDRLAAVAQTVARTISELESAQGADMPKINKPENLFEGFDQSRYDDEARERWPDQWENSQEYVRSLGPGGIERAQKEMTAAMIRMAERMAAGTPVSDPEVQADIEASYRSVARFWGTEPTAEAFAGLGQMYVDDSRFRATYEKIAVGLPEYYRDAMAHYARERLS
jgi:DNA-binding transcriptional MerR regulator